MKNILLHTIRKQIALSCCSSKGISETEKDILCYIEIWLLPIRLAADIYSMNANVLRGRYFLVKEYNVEEELFKRNSNKVEGTRIKRLEILSLHFGNLHEKVIEH